MIRVALTVGLLLALVALTGCTSDNDVRAACAKHGGVNAVSGNRFGRYVACRDGYYRTVR